MQGVGSLRAAFTFRDNQARTTTSPALTTRAFTLAKNSTRPWMNTLSTRPGMQEPLGTRPVSDVWEWRAAWGLALPLRLHCCPPA